MSEGAAQNGQISPFVELDRRDWAALAPRTAVTLSQTELVELRGLGDELDLREVEEVYLPLSRLINLYAENAQKLHEATDTFLGARYRRIARRRGKKKAIVAVGRSILVIIWHLLSDPHTRFQDLGADHYDRHVNTASKRRNHIRQLEALGFKVTLEPAA